MPAKNVIKQYAEGAYYHLYNHAVGKELLFQNKPDYLVFLSFLKKYLTFHKNAITLLQLNEQQKSLYKEISLLSYCLMPNHYHLLVKQSSIDAITKLIRRLCTKYSLYYNQKYQRRGTLFEGNYKAVLVKTDEQLLHLSRYIHLNPQLAKISRYDQYPYSSIKDYLGKKQTSWLKPTIIQNLLEPNTKNKPLSYKKFVEDYLGNSDTQFLKIKGLTLENPR